MLPAGHSVFPRAKSPEEKVSVGLCVSVAN
jgi:hypothetical protein